MPSRKIAHDATDTMAMVAAVASPHVVIPCRMPSPASGFPESRAAHHAPKNIDQPAVTRYHTVVQAEMPAQGLAARQLYIPNPMKNPNRVNSTSIPSATITPAQTAPQETRSKIPVSARRGGASAGSSRTISSAIREHLHNGKLHAIFHRLLASD